MEVQVHDVGLQFVREWREALRSVRACTSFHPRFSVGCARRSAARGSVVGGAL